MCRIMWSNDGRPFIKWFAAVLSGMAGVLEHVCKVESVCLEGAHAY